METTKLYVEYIVVGMETLAIIFLVIFIIIGDAFLPIIKYCIKNIVPSIIMLGWCYILGLIVDRIADIIYDKRKMHIKEKYPIEAETSIIVWEHFKQDAFATFKLTNQGRNSVGKTDARLFLYRFQQNVISHSGKSGTVFQTGCERSGNYVQSNGKNER